MARVRDGERALQVAGARVCAREYYGNPHRGSGVPWCGFDEGAEAPLPAEAGPRSTWVPVRGAVTLWARYVLQAARVGEIHTMVRDVLLLVKCCPALQGIVGRV